LHDRPILPLRTPVRGGTSFAPCFSADREEVQMAARHRAAGAAGALLIASVACAIWRGIEKPEVSLTRVHPEEMGLFEQQLDVGLRIYNPNQFPLEVRGIRFGIGVGGEPVAKGRDDMRFTIPADDEREVAVKARAQSIAILRRIAHAGDGLSYQVEGKLLLDNPQAQEVKFEQKSSLGFD
jgi:LEA14-like dessication related protein